MCFMFKILNCLSDCPNILEVSIHAPKCNVRDQTFLETSVCRTKYGTNAPIYRATETFNMHLSKLALFNVTLSSFKRKLTALLKI